MNTVVEGRRLDRGILREAVAAADWEQPNADTRYLTHDIHRYSGKFIPQIARAAIELLTEPGDLVVDPYVGSGTTLLEAALTDRRSLGVDMNPIAVRISEAKTTTITSSHLDELWDELSRPADFMLDGEPSPAPVSKEMATLRRDAARDPRFSDPWFEKWFEREVLTDLLVLDHAVARLPLESQRTLGRIALSDILRKSSRAHSGYPNVMFDRRAAPRPRPGRAFLASLQRCVGSVSSLPPIVDVDVRQADARSLPLADGLADAIVTHPPYIGSIPYAEYGLVSLKWFGEDPRALDANLTGGRRQSRDVVERFSDAYATAIDEMFRALRRGGGLFLMVGRPVVRGRQVDLARMSCDLAESSGFELVKEASRRGSNRRANKMGGEALLFFEKPAGG